jgi:hypothetical protein
VDVVILVGGHARGRFERFSQLVDGSIGGWRGTRVRHLVDFEVLDGCLVEDGAVDSETNQEEQGGGYVYRSTVADVVYWRSCAIAVWVCRHRIVVG